MEPDLLALKSKIDAMRILYGILFIASLVLILANWQLRLSGVFHLAWAVCLGGAVLTRLYRTSLVNRYNNLLAGGGPTPLA